MRVAAIVGIVLFASGLAHAAERGAAAGSGGTVQLLTQSKLDVPDMPEHQLVQAIADEEVKTPDKIGGVSFDGAKVKTLRQSDLVNGSGVVRGYSTWEAKGGEKLYLIFGYTIPPYKAGQDFNPFQGTFEWIGGTGGLQNVRGKGTIEGEISKRGEAHYRWAGSYEVVTGK